MNISEINFTLSQHLDRVELTWNKYSEVARYVLVKKKISKPIGLFDGNRVYIGTETEFTDFKIRNGEMYYYRLFVLPEPTDDFLYESDNKCILRVIAMQESEMENYAKYLYDNVPSDVRYRDATLKNQNKPLWRFMNLFCYPFNKLNVFADTMLSQVDIDTCDEVYLPYHAKWLGQFYDERFGADINRLILKTVYEAEPYIGTETGLKYILQRVFKAEVEMESRDTGNCFTNNENGLISNTLMTNGCTSVNSIKLFFDDDNQWLSNMQTTDSIMKIILGYCAVRTNFEMTSNLITQDAYDTSRMSDNYLFDRIIEVITDAYNVIIAEAYFDAVDFDAIEYETYKGLKNISSYLNSDKPDFGMTVGTSMISNDFVTNAVKVDTDGICQELVNSTNGGQTISNDFLTNGVFYNSSAISTKDYIIETSVDVLDKSSFYDTQSENVSEVQTDEFDKDMVDVSSDLVTQSELASYETYKFGHNIQSYPESYKKDFGTTNGTTVLSSTFVTNAVRYDVDGIAIDQESVTNGVQLLSSDFLTNSLYEYRSIVGYKDYISEVQTDTLDKTKLSDYDYHIDTIYEDESDFVKMFADELIEIDSDVSDEILMLIRDGLTTDAYSLLSNTFLTNVMGRRTEYVPNYDYIAKTTTTNNTSVTNKMLTSQTISGYDSNENISETNEPDSYSGVKSETEETNVLNSNESETLGNYVDDDSLIVLITRAHSLTCSGCMVANNFYTTDIKY